MNKEKWLIDFLEGELEEPMRFEMSRIIRKSAQDMELISSLNAMKKLIRHHDEVLEPTAASMKRVHNNIMEQILQSSEALEELKQTSSQGKKAKSAHLQIVHKS
jgi:hypothetical protein